jgi:hypothetical protein
VAFDAVNEVRALLPVGSVSTRQLDERLAATGA